MMLRPVRFKMKYMVMAMRKGLRMVGSMRSLMVILFSTASSISPLIWAISLVAETCNH